MASMEFGNNVSSEVADNPLAAGATTLNVAAGEGGNFPSSFPFLITIWDSSPYPGDDSEMEIVKCTGRTTDALTIVRAQEGTADVTHSNGEKVAMLITAGHFNDPSTGIITRLDTKDVANGIAGLDANTKLDIIQMRPVLEEYINHNGNVDNFMETITLGNGTATEDTTNHEIDLNTGVNLHPSYAVYQTKKTWILDSHPLVLNFIINNISSYLNSEIHIGITNSFTKSPQDNTQRATFRLSSGGSKYAMTGGTNNCGGSEITWSNGDLLTIVASTSGIYMYINGILVHSQTTPACIVSLAVHVGAVVYMVYQEATGSICSVDFISIKKYL